MPENAPRIGGTEIRSRLNEIRYLAYRNKDLLNKYKVKWNPLQNNITIDDMHKISKHPELREIFFKSFDDLFDLYNNNEIKEMLNTISRADEIQDQTDEIFIPSTHAKRGGVKKN